LSPGLSIAGINAQFGDAAVLSPDGTTIAFVAQEGEEKPPLIYIRRLDQLRAEPLLGTDNAVTLFFSPDSRWVGFWAGRKLRKIAVTGGAAVPLADAPELRGASWIDDDTIVFAPDKMGGTRLLRVPASGGAAAPLTALAEGELIQQWPQVLPGGKAVLFTSSGTPGMYNTADLVVQSLPAGPRRVVMRGGYHGRYLPSGHLVYIHDGTLYAAPFDLDRLEVTGPPVAAIEGMRSNSITGGAQFSLSAGGTLMYLPGPSVGAGIPMQWMDAQGKTTPLRPALANWANATFAPDGGRLVMDIREAPAGIWVYELAQDKLTPVTTGPGDNIKAVWSPDGRAIAFASNRGDKSTLNLYWQNADGTGEAHRLTESANVQHPGSWHPSGKFLAFGEVTGQHNEVMILPLEGDVVSGLKAGTPRPFLHSGTWGSEPVFSPDGRWLAYDSQESGRPEVYVQPFPGPGPKTRVSTDGGNNPTWSRTSHELFYGFFDGRIMVATYKVSGDTFVAEKPRLWSEGRYQTRGASRMFDLHPDGTRFALAPVSQSPTVTRPDKAVLVFNFLDELRRIAPVTPR
jgi:serine/threonine-protein kinase